MVPVSFSIAEKIQENQLWGGGGGGGGGQSGNKNAHVLKLGQVK